VPIILYKNMAISPTCDVCGKKLKEFGGLIFSPPDKKDIVRKYHICQDCFKRLKKSFKKMKRK